ECPTGLPDGLGAPTTIGVGRHRHTVLNGRWGVLAVVPIRGVTEPGLKGKPHGGALSDCRSYPHRFQNFVVPQTPGTAYLQNSSSVIRRYCQSPFGPCLFIRYSDRVVVPSINSMRVKRNRM